MRHNFLLFIFLMLVGIGNAESMPSKDQTIDFIKNTMNEMITVDPLFNCADWSQDGGKKINDIDYLKLDTNLYYDILRLEQVSDTCTHTLVVPLDKIKVIALHSDADLTLMFLCHDQKNA